jgi:hypothetical protein
MPPRRPATSSTQRPAADRPTEEAAVKITLRIGDDFHAQE